MSEIVGNTPQPVKNQERPHTSGVNAIMSGLLRTERVTLPTSNKTELPTDIKPGMAIYSWRGNLRVNVSLPSPFEVVLTADQKKLRQIYNTGETQKMESGSGQKGKEE